MLRQEVLKEWALISGSQLLGKGGCSDDITTTTTTKKKKKKKKEEEEEEKEILQIGGPW
jgi:hypothetical protein